MITDDEKKVDSGDDDVYLECDPKLECFDSCKWILPSGKECE